MEKKKNFMNKVFLTATLIVLLILLTFSVSATSHPYNTNTYSSRDPYNSYDYPQSSYRDSFYRDFYGSPYRTSSRYSYSKPYIADRYPYTSRAYYVRDNLRYTRDYNKYLRYNDFGQYRRVRGIFGNPINRYDVYVRNNDYIGGYFNVKFYFTDYYGRTKTETLNRYIPARRQSNFVFKDIYGDRYKYYDWSYEVISKTKFPARVYYN